MDAIGLLSLHDFKFSHNREHPTTDVKNIQIYAVVMSGIVEYGFTSQKIKSRHFYYPQAKLSLAGPYHHSKAETNYTFPLVKAEDYENLFQNVLL